MLNDASFSFIDRVKEIQLNIEDRRWQSALALSLTIPDICGGIAYPDQYKRHRDGKIILDKFKRYYPEYDIKDKVLYLKGKIPVNEFLGLRLMIKIHKLDVKDIRVNW